MADFSALKTSIQNYIKQNGNEEITGNLLQQILLSMVTTLGDSAINDLVTALNAEIANRGNADTTLQGNIDNEATARGNADTELGGRITTLQGVVNGIVANVENGYVYAGIATPSATPVSGKVFYLALTAGTYTNFGATVVPQGINILKYNGSAWSLDSFLGLDDAPTQGSGHLVKSGGVLDSIIKDGSAFDLSAYNNGTTYADLSAALTALNALPAAYKKGGMSMKFVQSSDNKYVQARCMAQNFTTDVTQWQGVDVEPTTGSKNLVESGGVALALNKVSEITKEDILETNELIKIEDDESNTIASIEPTGANFKNLKSNNIDLLTEIGKKVDKIEGKQLSTKDYTSDDEEFVNTLKDSSSFSPTVSQEEKVVIEDNNGNEVASITPEHSNFPGLRSDGYNVITEERFNPQVEDVFDDESEQAWTNDEKTDAYFKINQNGCQSKAYLDVNGRRATRPLTFLNGKKIGAIGDSITYGTNSTINFISWLASMTGMVTCNKAVPGKTLQQIYNQIDLLDNDCDIVFVMGGTNNYRAGTNEEKTIGEFIINTEQIVDTTMGTYHGELNVSDNTIAATLNKILIKLRQKFPKGFIILANPPKSRAGYDKSSVSQAGIGTYERFNPVDLKNAIEEAALLHSVTFADISSCVQINSQILQSEQLFYTYPATEPYGNNVDGLDRSHPTELGHKMIANYLYDLISNNASQIEFMLNI